MSNNLQTKNTFRQLSTALTCGVLALGMAATANADDTGALAGENRKNGAEFYVSADPDNNCAVTVTSNQGLRRFAFKNANGRTIRAGGIRRGRSSITGFVDLLTANPNGQLSLRTRDGKWTRLNAQFSLAFNECLADDGTEGEGNPITGEPTELCQFPEGLITEVVTTADFVENTPNYCFVSGPDGFVSFNNSLSVNTNGIAEYKGQLSGSDTYTRSFSINAGEFTTQAQEEMTSCLADVNAITSTSTAIGTLFEITLVPPFGDGITNLCSNFVVQ